MTSTQILFKAFLDGHDDQAWSQLLDNLQSSIHPVDSRAVRIWFAFYPLKVHQALLANKFTAANAQSVFITGKFRLADQVDVSHEFLYGHRYWPEVKRAVNEVVFAPPQSLDLEQQIKEVSRATATRLNVDATLLTAITAVAFMTLQQVGPDQFGEPPPQADYAGKWRKNPDRIINDRERDDSQGLLGFLKSINQEYSVTFREYEPGCNFRVINDQELTTASAQDDRDYISRDPRCIEGPIPVECRTAACGTCWVGVLSKPHKVSVPTSREITRMKEFGYDGFTGERDSPIRLACQTRALGNVSIVIPPWNGLIGRLEQAEGQLQAGGSGEELGQQDPDSF